MLNGFLLSKISHILFLNSNGWPRMGDYEFHLAPLSKSKNRYGPSYSSDPPQLSTQPVKQA